MPRSSRSAKQPTSSSLDRSPHGASKSFQSFRSWLIDRVSKTAFASYVIPDEQLDDRARELGVQTDVFIEARLLNKERHLKAGIAPSAGNKKKAKSPHWQLELLMPPYVFQQWKAAAKSRGLDGSAILRSLVNAYLSSTFEPQAISKHWILHGVVYKVPSFGGWLREHGHRYPYRERALIPPGARRALIIRAERRGCPPTTLANNLVMLMLNGLWAHPGTLPIVDCRSMYDDENRYYLGD